MFGSKGSVAPISPSTSSAAPAEKSIWLLMQVIQIQNTRGTGYGWSMSYTTHTLVPMFSDIVVFTFCCRIKGLTSDLIGQTDNTSDGKEGKFTLKENAPK